MNRGTAEYLTEQLRSAFAADSRVHELGLEVTVINDTIVLRGTVSTPSLREAVAKVAAEQAPDADIVNDVEVSPNPEPGPDSVEELG